MTRIRRARSDKTEVQPGDTIIFKIEVTNKGSVIAPEVVVTDKLPASVSVDVGLTKSSTGLVLVEGNSVTAQLGDLAPNDKVVVEVPAKVATGATGNVSNQASALYRGAANPALSNAYIAQVAQTAAPPEGPQTQPTSMAQPTVAAQPTAAPAQEPTAGAASEPTAGAQAPQPTVAVAPTPRPNPTQATTTAGGSASQTPQAPIPQTGGSFPLTLAVLLLMSTLAARYLRGYLRSCNGRRT